MAVDVRPIRTEADHAAALAELEELWGAPDGTPEGDRFEVLATLIDSYEAEHMPFDPPDPVAAIEFRLDQLGLSPDDLVPMIGSRPRVAEISGRKGELSLPMIRRLHDQLGIPADTLIRPFHSVDMA